MPVRSVADIRTAWGPEWADASDEEVLGAYSTANKLNPADVANRLGYDPGKGSLTNERLSGSADNYQSGLYRVGASAARGLGMDSAAAWADRKAEDNAFQADVAGSRAKALGGIDSYKDITGPSSFFNYAGGLAAQSLPYMGEALVGGIAGRALMGAGKAVTAANEALAAAKAAGNAAEIEQATVALTRAVRASERAGMAGATAASYPSAVGDILGNQIEQSGTTDGAAAAGLGVPYAALNGLLGVEGAIGRGRFNPLREGALDKVSGARGVAARAGMAGARTGAGEAVSETGQEVVNQAGRMAVDPNATLTDPAAMERYGESAVGGGTLGFLFGAGASRGRRSQEWAENQRPAAEAPGDLLAPEPTNYPLTVQGQRGLAPITTPVEELPPGADESYGFGAGQPFLPAPTGSTTQEQSRPGVLNVTPGGTVAPMDQLSGQQYDMLGGSDVFGTPASLGAQPADEPAPPVDTATPDMFAQTPTATLPTAFNPATEPSYNQPASGIKNLGAVAGNIRSQIIQRLGEDGDPATATNLAFDMAKSVGDPDLMLTQLQGTMDNVTKALTRLQKQVSGESNMLAPEEVEKRRATLERRQLTIMAAQELALQHKRDQVNALADEGRGKAQPGMNATGALTEGTEQSADIAREASRNAMLDIQIPDTDKAVQAAQEKRSAEDRSQILADVLADNKTRDPWQRFVAHLRKAGFANVNPSQDEIRTISTFMKLRRDFRKGPVEERDAVVNPPAAVVEDKPTPEFQAREAAKEKAAAELDAARAARAKAKPGAVKAADTRVAAAQEAVDTARGSVEPAPTKATNARPDIKPTPSVAPTAVPDGGGNTAASGRAAADTGAGKAGRAGVAPSAASAPPAIAGGEGAPTAQPAKRRALSAEDRADMAEMDSAVDAYNQEPEGDSDWHRRNHEARLRGVGEMLYEWSTDARAHPDLRAHAQELIDNFILDRHLPTFKAAEAERTRVSTQVPAVGTGLAAAKREQGAASAVTVKTVFKDGNVRTTKVQPKAAKVDRALYSTVYGENYGALAGKDVTISVPLEGGKTATMTVDAQKALSDIDARLEALEMVRRCLG